MGQNNVSTRGRVYCKKVIIKTNDHSAEGKVERVPNRFGNQRTGRRSIVCARGRATRIRKPKIASSWSELESPLEQRAQGQSGVSLRYIRREAQMVESGHDLLRRLSRMRNRSEGSCRRSSTAHVHDVPEVRNRNSLCGCGAERGAHPRRDSLPPYRLRASRKR